MFNTGQIYVSENVLKISQITNAPRRRREPCEAQIRKI